MDYVVQIGALTDLPPLPPSLISIRQRCLEHPRNPVLRRERPKSYLSLVVVWAFVQAWPGVAKAEIDVRWVLRLRSPSAQRCLNS